MSAPVVLPLVIIERGPTGGDPVSDFVALHEAVCEMAEIMFTDTGRHAPVWYIMLKDRSIQPIITDWVDDREQIASKEAVLSFLHMVEAKAYALVHECYMTRIETPKGASVEDAENMVREYRKAMPDRLVDLPEDQRDEVMMVSTFSSDHSVLMSKYLIDPHSKPQPTIGKRQDEDTMRMQMHGRMVDLFAQTPAIKEFGDFILKQRHYAE